ncbi:uncharacterized protein LACBIDRAFT_296801 [Laccaria bicolor S238N-H82]|uniref:Predicted protein n=1 Tax=Laccaria bicolor (strain S238N-H82 / ATCC MYA-4686) TaxID=486041 RepID=B0DRZ5_LACBS|nr:uncharacterized protein LACBIDRAFT_332215 [Laccaria bicolor S238N-H82]XP_001890619.1 uncharacterized protein LACBIDRAFT_296801 [Laccaria bicolor S238N-H82]EDQ98742.1 predicted protein [Laccaria bicolor S238N-H82]EDR02699.1 predicted protein [Laccaria bicolor S238N-H82]|eukprot:XP_001886743.1 predicted protein [Laccaria bicolor S238N-H82]
MAIAGPAAAALASLKPDQVTFLQSLEKAELHAHLNGSIPIAVIQQLGKEYVNSPSSTHGDAIYATIERLIYGSELETIDDFFSVFPIIYHLTSTPESLACATRGVLNAFLDGDHPQCNYLELRTGPRETEYMSRELYMRTVLNEAEKYGEKVGVILSLDRKTGEKTWQECLDIALKLKGEGRRLVGVDLCGEPSMGDVADFQTFFCEAKKAGLGVTLHIAEIISSTPEETLKLLSFQPDRLGHATFLNKEAMDIVIKNNICVEICLTSNLLSKTVTALESHHIRQYLKENHLIAICTDDILPFRTSLLAEYALLLAQPPLGLGLTEDEVREIGEMSLQARFTMGSS